MEQKHFSFMRDYPNLASRKFGTEVVQTSDDFFAAKERLIDDQPPRFIPDKYDDHGKWMDGWESRRRRDAGYDWCIVKLGVPGAIQGVEIDTRHFTGNYPPEASIDACPPGADPEEEKAWWTILPRARLNGNQQHFYEIKNDKCCQFVRLNIFPDGGVARLRLYGTVMPDWAGVSDDATVELSALKSGGSIIAYNDAHYGDVWALLSEGRGSTMGDGWETRRRRDPGNDWIIVALGARGLIEAIEIDTAHFKGNYPDGAAIQAVDISAAGRASLIDQSISWDEVMPRQKLQADTLHRFDEKEITAPQPVTHVKLNIFPDGGVSRFRVFGRRDP